MLIARIRKGGCLLFFLSLFGAGRAQRPVVHSKRIWVGYFNVLRINNRLSIGSDVQLRSQEWIKKWSQQVVNSAATYKIAPSLTVTAGITWLHHAQYDSSRMFYRKEWRPWQEVTFQKKWQKVTMAQRVRSEERYVQQVVNHHKNLQYQSLFRIRCRVDLGFPLWEKVVPSVSGEAMLYPRPVAGLKFFDQTRLYAGVMARVSPVTQLQLQYVKGLQLRMNGQVLENQDVFRFNVHQQFNWKKKV